MKQKQNNSNDWEREKELYSYFKNILLDSRDNKVPHPVLISQLFTIISSELQREIENGWFDGFNRFMNDTEEQANEIRKLEREKVLEEVREIIGLEFIVHNNGAYSPFENHINESLHELLSKINKLK